MAYCQFKKNNFKKLLLAFPVILLAKLTLLHSPVFSQPASPDLEPQVKKIIMMLNIVKMEYELGIAGGKIINAAEYEESRVFVDQAFER